MKTLITVCARGGSKGIPGKNIRRLNGVPLIHYTIAAALRYKAGRTGCTVSLSTDDDTIIEVASQAGLTTTYRRPELLATDEAGKIDVLDHLLRFEENQIGHTFDLILDLDVTSPLRTQKDLTIATDRLIADYSALNIFSVSPARRNPYFNMVEVDGRGRAKVVKSNQAFKTRQAAPKVYDMNASFYIYRREFFRAALKTAITPQSIIYEVPHLCFDLDEPIDFEVMEYLMAQDKIGFEF